MYESSATNDRNAFHQCTQGTARNGAKIRTAAVHYLVAKRSTMSEENKAIIRRYFDEVLNKGNLAEIDTLVAPNYEPQGDAQPRELPGREGLKQFITEIHNAFPDVQFTIDEELADGNSVAIRWTVTGTHKGAFMGIAATDKRATVTGIDIYKIDNGQIIEAGGQWDRLGLMQQLGAIPSS